MVLVARQNHIKNAFVEFKDFIENLYIHIRTSKTSCGLCLPSTAKRFSSVQAQL